jgi:PASTA domain
MARTFAITTTAPDPLTVDARGHAEAVFTVTNTTSRPIRGMGKPKAMGDTKSEWLRVQGDTERDFGAGATEQFTVSFDGPKDQPASAPSTGATPIPPAVRKYSFRLDVASATNPEEDFTEGPSVTAVMTPAPVIRKAKFPWWIIPVAAVVILAVGITLFLVLRTKKVEVPNVVGKPATVAVGILKERKLEASIKHKSTGTVPVGTVVSQDPEASGKAPEGSTVALIVEGQPVPLIVPRLSPR